MKANNTAERCREMRARPMAITAIAKELGITRQRVSQCCKDMDVPRQTRVYEPQPDAVILAVLNAAQSSDGVASIARGCGVSEYTVKQILTGERYADRFPEIERKCGRERQRHPPAEGTVMVKVAAFLAPSGQGGMRFVDLRRGLGISTGSLSGTLHMGARRGVFKSVGRGVWAVAA